MPNYRSNMNDYGRRQNCGCTPPQAPYANYRQPNECSDHDDVLDGLALAMAYVPWQNWECPFEIENVLCHGTIFPQLDKPFCRIGGTRR